MVGASEHTPPHLARGRGRAGVERASRSAGSDGTGDRAGWNAGWDVGWDAGWDVGWDAGWEVGWDAPGCEATKAGPERHRENSASILGEIPP
jgi:hypothetical protein